MKCDNTFCITVPPVTEIAQIVSFLTVLFFDLFLLNNLKFLEFIFYLMGLINNYNNKESASLFRKLILQKCLLSLCWAATASVNQNLLLWLIAAILSFSTIHSPFVPTAQLGAPRGHPGSVQAGASPAWLHPRGPAANSQGSKSGHTDAFLGGKLPTPAAYSFLSP